MATVSEHTDTRTPGSVLASRRLDSAIDDAIAGRPARYPDGASFVGADMPRLGEILADSASEHRAVVLVYPDGRELIVEPREPVAVSQAA